MGWLTGLGNHIRNILQMDLRQLMEVGVFLPRPKLSIYWSPFIFPIRSQPALWKINNTKGNVIHKSIEQIYDICRSLTKQKQNNFYKPPNALKSNLRAQSASTALSQLQTGLLWGKTMIQEDFLMSFSSDGDPFSLLSWPGLCSLHLFPLSKQRDIW